MKIIYRFISMEKSFVWASISGIATTETLQMCLKLIFRMRLETFIQCFKPS